jgi:hypothetical protein
VPFSSATFYIDSSSRIEDCSSEARKAGSLLEGWEKASLPDGQSAPPPNADLNPAGILESNLKTCEQYGALLQLVRDNLRPEVFIREASKLDRSHPRPINNTSDVLRPKDIEGSQTHWHPSPLPTTRVFKDARHDDCGLCGRMASLSMRFSGFNAKIGAGYRHALQATRLG